MKKKKEHAKSRKRRFTVVCGSSGNMERWWWHKKTLQASFRRWWHGEKYKIYLISILGSNNCLSRSGAAWAATRKVWLRYGSETARLISSSAPSWAGGNTTNEEPPLPSCLNFKFGSFEDKFKARCGVNSTAAGGGDAFVVSFPTSDSFGV